MNKETGEKENGSTDGYDSDEERVNVINQSILFSGELHQRNLFSDAIDVNNTIMFKDSFWSKRFAVIRSGEVKFCGEEMSVYLHPWIGRSE